MQAVARWFNSLPDFARRALRTFAQVFVGTFGTAFLGWLASVQNAVTNGGDIPSPAVLGAVAVSAFVAASSAAVTSAWNYAEDKGWVKPLLKDQPTGANAGSDQ